MRPTLGPATGLDRLSEKRTDRDFLEGLLAVETTRFMVMANGKPVVIADASRKATGLRWFAPAQVEGMGLAVHEALFLGVETDTGHARFAVATSEHYARNAPGARELLHPIVDLRNLAAQGALPPHELALAAQAVSLVHWHEINRCCGRCGGSMSVKHGGWKRKCWSCGFEAFPRMDPVVIMAVTDGERIVLAHESRFPDKMYSTLAGFLEPGDDIENAVRRETMEEVGLKVGEVRFLGSQPWPFAHSLMLGCIARAEPAELKVNTAEVEEARWVSREEATQMLEGRHPLEHWLPGPHSMAHQLVREFLAGRT